MRGYYLFFGSNSQGVYKKIKMQIAEISKFADIELVNVQTKKRSPTEKAAARLPWAAMGYDYDEAFLKLKSPDFLYIRRTVIDSAGIHFLKKVREDFPKCKIIIEIFTYPYDIDDFFKCDFKYTVQHIPFYIKDKIYRKKLVNYIDRFVTYSLDDKIFGVETIRTTNGVDVANIKKVNVKLTEESINLISVARMQIHHGYERLIEGLYNYYLNGGMRNIVYHVVGDGPEEKTYKDLVKKYSLEKHVVFHGRQSGEALDKIYDNAVIAISSLGLYKYKINVISTLKTCEYMAKGLPVVQGCKMSTIDGVTPPYVCEFKNDNSPINVNKIIEFYDDIYARDSADTITDSIRKYAMEHMNMEYVMKPIIRYILGE